jgi:hypothetical protein
MFDSHGYYGQPGQTAQQFLPQGLFGAAPTGFSPYAAFGTLPAPWGHPTGPSIGGWPGQQLPLGPFAPQGLFGSLPGQQTQQLGPYPQMGQPPIGYPFGAWPGQMQLACITPQGLIAILPGQFAQPIGLGQPIGTIGAWPGQQQQLGSHFGAAAGRSFLPYQVPSPVAYA